MHTLHAQPDWRRVALISDLHLDLSQPATASAWVQALQVSTFDALFVLGDFFELWVGDDALQPSTSLSATQQAEVAFWQQQVAHLTQWAAQCPVYFMVGNRDFLAQQPLMQHTGMHALPDPTLLCWGAQRIVLSHGDGWCTDDTDYQRFKTEVRHPDWQRQFLRQSLAQRLQQGRAMRQTSQARQAQREQPADVNLEAVDAAARQASATLVVHGHTHRPSHDTLPSGCPRVVLTDWDAGATPPRGHVLSLGPQGWQREPGPASSPA